MSKFKVIDPTVKALSGPILVIVGFASAILILFNYSYPIIQDKITKSKEAKLTENMLQQRVEQLKLFRDGILDDRSGEIYTVLPDQNSSALLISHVKSTLSSQNNELTSVEADSVTKQDKLKTTSLTYEYSSPDFASAIAMTMSLRETAPISLIEEMKISNKGGGPAESELKTTIFWSELPEKIPSLNEPVVELTGEDQELLSKVLQYKFPQFTNLNTEFTSGRVNPFN